MKEIFINFNDLKNIEKSEKLKLKYENEGLKLISIESLRINEYKMIYGE